MSKKLLTLATMVALTGLASTAKAGESPSIIDSVTEAQRHVLSNEEMSKVTGTFYYNIKPGDTLSGISDNSRYEGKSIASWQEIYKARGPKDPHDNPRRLSNRDIIGPNPNLIHPGQTIWVPDLPGNFPSYLRGKPL